MKYQDWLEEWLNHYVKNSVKHNTYLHYREFIKIHIAPQLGEYAPEDITPRMLQMYVTELLQCGHRSKGCGLSANTVNGIISVIQASLKDAHVLGLTPTYIGDKIKRPKVYERGVTCFSVKEQKTIQAYVMKKGTPKLFGIILCLYTGLRIGELLALEWQDIDFAKGELTVCKTCYYGKDDEGHYCRLTDKPKTASSSRVIPIPKQIIAGMKHIKKNSHAIYVISHGIKPISIRSYQRTFELLLKKLHIAHRGFHALRHTFATRALECGMDVKTLSEILGHKSPTITLNRYAHSFMKHKKEMMNLIGKLL